MKCLLISEHNLAYISIGKKPSKSRYRLRKDIIEEIKEKNINANFLSTSGSNLVIKFNSISDFILFKLSFSDVIDSDWTYKMLNLYQNNFDNLIATLSLTNID